MSDNFQRAFEESANRISAGGAEYFVQIHGASLWERFQKEFPEQAASPHAHAVFDCGLLAGFASGIRCSIDMGQEIVAEARQN